MPGKSLWQCDLFRIERPRCAIFVPHYVLLLSDFFPNTYTVFIGLNRLREYHSIETMSSLDIVFKADAPIVRYFACMSEIQDLTRITFCLHKYVERTLHHILVDPIIVLNHSFNIGDSKQFRANFA